MGVRLLWLVLAALLVPAGANASGHNWDVFFAGSIVKFNSAEDDSDRAKRLRAQPSSDPWLGGGHFTAAMTTHRLPRAWSIAVDFSANAIELDGDDQRDLSQLTVMLGPRWTRKTKMGMPLVHVMPIGYTRNVGGDSIGIPDDAWAVAVGVGFESASRPEKFGEVGFRVQYDRLFFSRGKPQDRLSIGGILRFTEPAENRQKKVEERAAKKGSKKDRP